MNSPGPWHIVPVFKPYNPGIIIGHNVMAKEKVVCFISAFKYQDDIENKANARLIASAPEMREWLIWAYRNLLREREVDFLSFPVINAMRNAIEHATGMKIDEVMK